MQQLSYIIILFMCDQKPNHTWLKHIPCVTFDSYISLLNFNLNVFKSHSIIIL
jgi:hypothetical protein